MNAGSSSGDIQAPFFKWCREKEKGLTLVLFSDKASTLPESLSSGDSWEEVKTISKQGQF